MANESVSPAARADDYLPDWSARQFVILDPTGLWAAPIAAQLAGDLTRQSGFHGRIPDVETCESVRQVLLCCDDRSTLGVILLLTGIERECLTLLAPLSRAATRVPVLAICRTQHTELLPTLLEAGVHTALFDVVNDVPIAAWCVQWVT